VDCGVSFDNYPMLSVFSGGSLTLTSVEILPLSEKGILTFQMLLTFKFSFNVNITNITVDSFTFEGEPFEFNEVGVLVLDGCIFRNVIKNVNTSLIHSSCDQLYIFNCQFFNIWVNSSGACGGCIYFFMTNKKVFVINGETTFYNCSAGGKKEKDGNVTYDGWGGGIYLLITKEYVSQTLFSSTTSYFLLKGNILFSDCNACYGNNIFISCESSLSQVINDLTFYFNYDTSKKKLYDLMGYSDNDLTYAIPLLRFLLPYMCLTAVPEFNCPDDMGCCTYQNSCIFCSEIECVSRDALIDGCQLDCLRLIVL
jgi:hypothetical protein